MQTEKSAIVLAPLVLFGQKCSIQHWLQGSCLCLDKGFPWCPGSRHSVRKGLPVHLHSCNTKAQAGGGFHSKNPISFTSEGEALVTLSRAGLGGLWWLGWDPSRASTGCSSAFVQLALYNKMSCSVQGSPPHFCSLETSFFSWGTLFLKKTRHCLPTNPGGTM